MQLPLSPEGDEAMSADELFAGSETQLGSTLDAANEAFIARMVKSGSMPPAVLDHLGHVKHDIFNPACEFCKPPQRESIEQ